MEIALRQVFNFPIIQRMDPIQVGYFGTIISIIQPQQAVNVLDRLVHTPKASLNYLPLRTDQIVPDKGVYGPNEVQDNYLL